MANVCLPESVIKNDAANLFDQKLSFFLKSQIGKFMECEISKSLLEETRTTILDIKDPQKIVLATYLLNRWVSYEVNGDIFYIKHVKSPKKNVLYQIIISGDDTDGIYEMQFKGTKIKLSKIKDVLKIESNGNYELAQFKGPDKQYYSISRNLPDFREKILATGYITKEELDRYSSKDSSIKAQLPRILL